MSKELVVSLDSENADRKTHLPPIHTLEFLINMWDGMSLLSGQIPES